MQFGGDMFASIMLKSYLLPAFFFLTAAPATSAFASGDFACDPVWAVKHVERDDCSNTAFLSPGNDSRVNLQMLMLDRRGVTPLPAGSADAADPVLFSLDDFNAVIEAVVTGKPVKAPDDTAAQSDYAEGEGSRCLSNPTGVASFVDALNGVRGMPDTERIALKNARGAISSECDGGEQKRLAAVRLAVNSAPAKQFAAYLVGAAAFYDGDFDTAHKSFAGLSASNIAWLKEASRYMLARVELNRAQIHAFDEFDTKPNSDRVDTAALTAAEAGFRAYLHDYPNGAYAASARGLLRRVDWLGGKMEKLGDDYARLIVQADLTGPGLNAKTLSQEIDNKLLDETGPQGVNDPLLLATIDLMQMRGPDTPAAVDPAHPPKPQSFGLTELEGQRPSFAKNPALFEYLRAAHHFYVENDAAGALALLPASSAADGPYLAFSRQVLRGMALEALKDKAARAQWTGLFTQARQPGQRGVGELGLALNHEREGDLAAVFAPGSPIRNHDIRSLILLYDASAPLLRDRARATGASDDERRLALYVLLYKEITRARYQAFLTDAALLTQVPPAKPKDENDGGGAYDLDLFSWSGGGSNAEAGFTCPSLRGVARVLVQRPADPHARLCLGEFVREHDLDGFTLNKQQPAGQLGSAASQFPGADPARLEIYKAVIADPKAPVGDKTYALYRAVNCYGPSGYNHCDGVDVPQSQRKQWFKTLKSDYPSSPWASALKYFW